MATERLSMRKTREILRQKWELSRTHREIAASVGQSLGRGGDDAGPGQGSGARLGADAGADRRGAGGTDLRPEGGGDACLTAAAVVFTGSTAPMTAFPSSPSYAIQDHASSPSRGQIVVPPQPDPSVRS